MTASHAKERTLQREIAAAVESSLPGVEVLAVELATPSRFCVYVDHPAGVDHALCARVTAVLERYLDDYTVEVSSPGLDRLLRSDREFRWAVGKRVRIWQAGGQETRGRLAEATAERLVVEAEGQRVELPRASVTKARLDADLPWARRE